MDVGTIFGVIVMALCGFGCGALFFGIGVWAGKAKKPVHFWAGSRIDPRTITNVAAYNRENARMWKKFSVSDFKGSSHDKITREVWKRA